MSYVNMNDIMHILMQTELDCNVAVTDAKLLALFLAALFSDENSEYKTLDDEREILYVIQEAGFLNNIPYTSACTMQDDLWGSMSAHVIQTYQFDIKCNQMYSYLSDDACA